MIQKDIDQSLLNCIVYCQVLLEAWDEVEQNGFKPKHQLKHHIKGFKEESEKLIKEFWKHVPKDNELDFVKIVDERLNILKENGFR